MRSDCKIDATEHIKKHLTRTHMRNIQRTISHNHLINDIQKFYNEKKEEILQETTMAANKLNTLSADLWQRYCRCKFNKETRTIIFRRIFFGIDYT